MAKRKAKHDLRPKGADAALFRGFLVRLPALALLWWLLTEGRWDAWLIGAPTVAAAAAVSALLAPGHSWRLRPLAAGRFVLLFLWHSLHGGVDVAWRALHPRLPIDPQLRDYRLRLPEGTARVFFVEVISLMPGTVSADLRGERLTLHVLDGRAPVDSHLSRLEHAVADLFAVPLAAAPSPARSRP